MIGSNSREERRPSGLTRRIVEGSGATPAVSFCFRSAIGKL
jgi:hypothetical protein